MKKESIFKILKILYDLFLKGHTVNTPVGPITLPNQKNTLPGGAIHMGMGRGYTLGLLCFIVFGVPIAILAALAGWEWKTLKDDIPGNHITATLRWAFKQQPGAVVLALAVWVGFLSAVAAGIGAHAWWQ